MTTTASMLDAHPRRPFIDTSLHGDTIEILVEAARTARQCADACLHEADPLRHCISLNLDVADIASATANMVLRISDPAALVAALEACRATLMACASACRSEGAHLRQCAVCADACERAEEQCVRMAAAVSHIAGTDGGDGARPPLPTRSTTLGPTGTCPQPA
jgi:hypothetical protein